MAEVESTREEVIRLIREEVERMLLLKWGSALTISEDQSLEADLGVDSLELVNLLTMIDNRLGIASVAAHPKLVGLKTVGDLLRAYISHSSGAADSPPTDPDLQAALRRARMRRR